MDKNGKIIKYFIYNFIYSFIYNFIMNTLLRILKKIFLIFLIFLIFSFFVSWFKIYKESNKKGLERFKGSFFGALFWYLWGLISIVKGDSRTGRFDPFLYIYGIKQKDFID